MARGPDSQLPETARDEAKVRGAYIDWDDEKHPVSLPASKELRLEPGVPMGGLVKDEDGKPVAGASVTITAPVTEAEKANYVFNLGTTTTDDQGRWQIDEAPANLAVVTVYVKHSRYRHKPGEQAGGRESLVILTRGLTVKGRVVDSAGKPVKGAKAVLGYDIWGTNPPRAHDGRRGEFVLENCESGPSIVTVQADGFAPEFQEVRVAQTGETTCPSSGSSRGRCFASRSWTGRASRSPASTGRPTPGASIARSGTVMRPTRKAASPGRAHRATLCSSTSIWTAT